jgi:acyl dehydratase
MATVQAEGIEGLKALQGRRIGPTEWREVTQRDIDDFARLSGDDQWIHVDVERVRFPAPVPAGSRIRASAEVTELEDVGGGWWQVVTRFTVDVEGSDKPACVADSVGRALPE